MECIQPKGVKPKMWKRKLRSGVKWQGALQQKGVKLGSSVYTNCSPIFFSFIITSVRQSRIIENNNRQTDHNVTRRVTVSEQYMSTACTNMATMCTFKSYVGQIYNTTRTE
jgi:hypothetical protein